MIKSLMIGCATVIVLAIALIVAAVLWLGASPSEGVRLANNMETYALAYLQQHKLLELDEELRAYYDASLARDGSEAVVITDQRVIYHKNGTSESLALDHIVKVIHRKSELGGDVFTILAASGKAMEVEIAPLSGGETFKHVLDHVRASRGAAPVKEKLEL